MKKVKTFKSLSISNLSIKINAWADSFDIAVEDIELFHTEKYVVANVFYNENKVGRIQTMWVGECLYEDFEKIANSAIESASEKEIVYNSTKMYSTAWESSDKVVMAGLITYRV